MASKNRNLYQSDGLKIYTNGGTLVAEFNKYTKSNDSEIIDSHRA